MSIRPYRATRLVFTALAAAAACLLPSAGLAQAENSGLILDTEPPGLFLLYSGDVIGYIEPCG